MSQTYAGILTVASSAAVFTASAVQGIDGSVWLQGGVIAAGVTVWRVYDRREQASNQRQAKDRRESDHAKDVWLKAKDARISVLEAKVDTLTDQLIAARWTPNTDGS